MADRLRYYFREKVTEAELNLGFELLEQADQNLATDIGVFGIISGGVPAPHSPLADLSVDLTAPARAYDHAGQRVFFGTGQTVDCAVDLVGIPTDVSTAGNERWLGIFLRFRRELSDPRTDGNSQQVYFRQDESFELVVRQAPEGAVGVAPKVALPPDELLVCDVRRRPGQTQILSADIDTSRRQAFVFAQGTSVAVEPGTWSILAPLAGNAQAAFDEVDAELREHFTATGRRHPASSIDYAPHGFVQATQLQAAVDEVVDDLSSTATGNPGASHVGADAAPGTPNALPAGSVDGQLSMLLGFLNAHQGVVSGAHNATAIAAAAHSFLSGTNVQSQLQQLTSALGSTAIPSGASRIGISDSSGQLGASDVEGALAELMGTFALEHYRGNEANGGYHRTIRQPNLGGTKALLWDSFGVGGSGPRLRVYLDNTSLWFTLNTNWTGSAWERIQSAPCTAIRLGTGEFELLYQPNISGPFTTWERRWNLTMNSSPTAFFRMAGPASDRGRLGAVWTNTHSATAALSAGGAITFHNEFETTPSSITLAVTYSTVSSAAPTVISATPSGFGFIASRTLSAGQSAVWMGTYDAIS
ncbi:MAG: hypothetical protein AB7K71_17080 [Polyangiaceae bacterium]